MCYLQCLESWKAHRLKTSLCSTFSNKNPNKILLSGKGILEKFQVFSPEWKSIVNTTMLRGQALISGSVETMHTQILKPDPKSWQKYSSKNISSRLHDCIQAALTKKAVRLKYANLPEINLPIWEESKLLVQNQNSPIPEASSGKTSLLRNPSHCTQSANISQLQVLQSKGSQNLTSV